MERLLNAKELAQLWVVKVPTVYTWVSQRRIPFQKINGALRFSPSALSRWLAIQTRKSDGK
jgi:excisionase family DNA binding protein